MGDRVDEAIDMQLLMDDMAFLVAHSSPIKCKELAEEKMALWRKAWKKKGLKVNPGVNKSEAIVRLA
eukprot:9098434-Prorocentrum_lima.AAC.1